MAKTLGKRRRKLLVGRGELVADEGGGLVPVGRGGLEVDLHGADGLGRFDAEVGDSDRLLQFGTSAGNQL